MGFKGFWENKSRFAQLIFIMIILYAISSINVLLLAVGILPHIPGIYLNPYVLIGFALVSFVFTVLISAYHLSTMIRRRKRKYDHMADGDKTRAFTK